MAAYSFLVADMVTGVIKAELPLDGVQYGRVLDRAGSFSATIPLRHPKATPGNLSTGNTLVYILRDGQIMFSGILYTARASSGDTSTVQIGGEGLWSYWTGPSGAQGRGRFLKDDKTYTATDQLDIARDLLAYSMAAAGSFQIDVDDTMSGVLRDRVYHGSERRNIGAQIQAECDVADGYDFYVQSTWNGDAVGHKLWFASPLGRETSLSLDLRTNIVALTYSEDATSQANDVTVVGATAGTSPLFGTASAPPIGAYPLYEGQFSDTPNNAQDALDAEASALLSANRLPYRSISDLKVRVTANTQPGAWQVGDRVTVTARDGWVDVEDAWYRITADLVTVDSNGGEIASLTVAPVEVTTVVRRPDGEWFRINDLESRVYALEYKS